jgi:hypothetical protein
MGVRNSDDWANDRTMPLGSVDRARKYKDAEIADLWCV